MKSSGLTEHELADAYKKEVRSSVEMAVPVWHSGLTQQLSNQIESVQKCSLAAILGIKYNSYEEALKLLNLERLDQRRTQLCKRFISKNMKSDNPLLSVNNNKSHDTRRDPKSVKEFRCRTQAYFDSSLPFLVRLYNERFGTKKDKM